MTQPDRAASLLRRAAAAAAVVAVWFILSRRGLARAMAAVVAAVALEWQRSGSPLVVNQLMKLIRGRHRPDRTELDVPESRWVLMPSSTSFPSGHSASAAAFAWLACQSHGAHWRQVSHQQY